MNKCYLCENNSCQINNGATYNCSDCGEFKIEDNAFNPLKTIMESNKTKIKDNIHNIRGYLSENRVFTLSTTTFDKLINGVSSKPPKVSEKLDKLINILYKNTDYPGENLNILIENDKLYLTKKKNNLKINLIPVLWAKNHKEALYYLDELADTKKFIAKTNLGQNPIGIKITSEGFQYIENTSNKTSNIGFCAMWFDDSMTNVWEEAFKPAIIMSGYNAKRIDKHFHTNGIVDEIKSLVRKSKFIIADLTSSDQKGDRGGVYYEAGFADGLNIPVIYTCGKNYFDNGRHFDVQHYHCISWTKENLDGFKNELNNRIEGLFGRGDYTA